MPRMPGISGIRTWYKVIIRILGMPGMIKVHKKS